MTLRELKNLTRSTRGLKTPGPKALRESGVPIVAINVTSETMLTVYENGFAIYRRDRRVTVLAVDDCGDYSYFFATGESSLSAECFLDMDYSIPLSLLGEDRLVHNMHSTSELHEISYSDQKTEWGAMKDASQDVLEKILRKELIREVFGCMTERQVQVMKMYYYEQMTTREIAEVLGISHQGVTKSLELAKVKVLRKMKNF